MDTMTNFGICDTKSNAKTVSFIFGLPNHKPEFLKVDMLNNRLFVEYNEPGFCSYRSVAIPVDVDVESAHGVYKDGQITVTFTRTNRPRPVPVPIEWL